MKNCNSNLAGFTKNKKLITNANELETGEFTKASEEQTSIIIQQIQSALFINNLIRDQLLFNVG